MGWELMIASRVAVVHAIKSPTVIVVRYEDGATEEVPYVKEDTAENKANIKGSELPESDSTTPGVEAEPEPEVS